MRIAKAQYNGSQGGCSLSVRAISAHRVLSHTQAHTPVLSEYYLSLPYIHTYIVHESTLYNTKLYFHASFTRTFISESILNYTCIYQKGSLVFIFFLINTY